MFSWIRAILTATTLGVWGMGGAAFAETAASSPNHNIILTVNGDIQSDTNQKIARFDLDTLRSLEPRTITTSTIWTTGVQVFEGVSLYTLMSMLDAKDKAIEATALNDYMIDIPASDITADGPIIAYERNGVPMSVRDKGPLWIIYPYDADPVFQSEVVYARSIWQLDRITVRE